MEALCRHRCREGSAGRASAPSGETFAVARDGEGLARLVDRLRALAPRAGRHGGHRRLRDHRRQRAGRGAACRWRWSIPARSAISPAPPASWPRPTASMPRPSPISPRRSGRPTPADRRRRGAGPGRAGRPPPPGHRDDGRRSATAAAGPPSAGCSRAIDRHLTLLQAELSELERRHRRARSATARPGRPTPICWPASPASARRRCAP